MSHPATEETGAASWGTPSLPGLPDERLGGEGTPAVAAFTPEPLALALGVSTESAMALLADTLDLVHRLPRVWAQVQALAVPAWKARRIAQATHALSQPAAAYVDEQVAARADRTGWPTLRAIIDQAVAKQRGVVEVGDLDDLAGVDLFEHGSSQPGGTDIPAGEQPSDPGW